MSDRMCYALSKDQAEYAEEHEPKLYEASQKATREIEQCVIDRQIQDRMREQGISVIGKARDYNNGVIHNPLPHLGPATSTRTDT